MTTKGYKKRTIKPAAVQSGAEQFKRLLTCDHEPGKHVYCAEWARNLSNSDLLWWASCTKYWETYGRYIYMELAIRLDSVDFIPVIEYAVARHERIQRFSMETL